MTDPFGPEDQEALRAEAADWFVRVQSDAAGEDDWLALEAWLAGSPARRRAFGAVERLWIELDEAVEFGRAPDAPAPLPLFDASRRTPARRRSMFASRAAWAIAASLALAIAAGVWWRAAPPPAQVFATAKGERRAITLADGSRIELNSGSKLVARVGRGRRRVTLADGEAIFDVAKDPGHPFIVSVGDQRVTVVGTRFDILRNRGLIEVTVSRGVVKVGPAHGGGEEARLTPGLQLRHEEGAATSQIFKAPVDDVFAWKDGYLIYRTRTLAEVAADLNRYFTTPVRVEGPAAQLTFSGALMIDDEDAVLKRLQSFLPITVVRTPGEITIRSR